jgi:outer membrane lipoprotein-sorting protein
MLNVKGTIVTVICLSALITGLPISAPGAIAEDSKGLEIARETEKRDSGFVNYSVDLKMILKNRQGQEKVRELRISVLEVENDGDKILVVFDTPRDVKGTAFLSFSHRTADDEQWLYLPALKRVKRIASKNRSSPFMGSEFSYEDMASQEVEKFTYRWIRDDVLEGLDTFVIERYPADDMNSGYRRQVVWVDKDEFKIRKVQYFDQRDSLLKTLTVETYQKFENELLMPLQFSMVNHQTGKTTILQYANYRFGVGLDERDFTKNSLIRTR